MKVTKSQWHLDPHIEIFVTELDFFSDPVIFKDKS